MVSYVELRSVGIGLALALAGPLMLTNAQFYAVMLSEAVVLIVVPTILQWRDRRRLGLGALKRATGARDALGILLSAGETVLRDLDTADHRKGLPGRPLELGLANEAALWHRVTEQTIRTFLEPIYLSQFNSRAGLTLNRPRPASLDDTLVPYWESVAWRLEWLNDRMNRLSPIGPALPSGRSQSVPRP